MTIVTSFFLSRATMALKVDNREEWGRRYDTRGIAQTGYEPHLRRGSALREQKRERIRTNGSPAEDRKKMTAHCNRDPQRTNQKSFQGSLLVLMYLG